MNTNTEQQLDKWYQTTTGRLLLHAEHHALERLLSDTPGQYWAQIGGPLQTQWLTDFAPGPVFYFQPRPQTAGRSHRVQTLLTELSILADSLDVVLLPHVLESVTNQDNILAEIYRSLAPEGLLVILSFNVMSLWRWSRVCQKTTHQIKTLSGFKIKHWLSQAQLTVLEHKTVYFRPQLRSARGLERLLALEAIGQLCWPMMGASHIIIAQKQVATLTSTGDQLEARVAISRNHCAQPTAKTRHR